MPEYLTPGVYVEEIEMGAKPIEGVSTSTAGFLGETERGPTKPKLVTSWLQYQRIFGSFSEGKYLPYAVKGFFDNGGQRCYIGRIVIASAQSAALNLKKGDNDALKVEAIGEGEWGNNIAIKVSKGSLEGFKLSIFCWSELPGSLYDPDSDSKTTPRPIAEVFDNISLDEKSPNYYEKSVNGISNLIIISTDGIKSVDMPDSPSNVTLLEGGNNGKGSIASSDYERTDITESGKRKGLSGFEEIDDISIVYVPNAQDISGLPGALITHCEELKDRFAIIDSKQGDSDAGSVDPRTSITDTKYAAFYYPWIKIVDPNAGFLRLIPPGGHIAGIYARSDTERGVFKAPANEIVRGASELQFQITKGEQGVLNPKGVNVIRAFPGRGIRVWGARTMSSDSLWKYVNVRRLFIFLEESIDDGTQWVVFEPNDEKLWDRVKQTINQFLTQVWKDGALMGTKPEEAFFVKCDRTTMTQNDIDNGRLIVVIGVAPVKPAEFVIFRIGQWTAGAKS
ncbi:MAG TPA: phage tail sheath family protein [Methanobacterium sp.]|nr:phage tail sheath family protein [Methanobacterium sp.]